MKNKNLFSLGMTVLWFIVFVAATHDWILGLCLGLGMGAAFGLFDRGEESPPASAGKKPEDAVEPASPDDSGKEKP